MTLILQSYLQHQAEERQYWQDIFAMPDDALYKQKQMVRFDVDPSKEGHWLEVDEQHRNFAKRLFRDYRYQDSVKLERMMRRADKRETQLRWACRDLAGLPDKLELITEGLNRIRPYSLPARISDLAYINYMAQIGHITSRDKRNVRGMIIQEVKSTRYQHILNHFDEPHHATWTSGITMVMHPSLVSELKKNSDARWPAWWLT